MWHVLAGSVAIILGLPRATGHYYPVDARFTPDGRHVIVADPQRGVTLWMVDGRLERTLHGRAAGGGTRGTAVAPDGRVLTAPDRGEPLTAFNATDWKPVPLWTPPGRGASGPLAPEPHGCRVALASGELVDLGTGTLVGRWRPKLSGITFVPVWATGRAAIACCGDVAVNVTTLEVFDPDTETRITELRPPPRRRTNAAVFTTDGRHLLTGGTDGVVRVYDADTWAEPRAFDWNQGPIHSLAASPDGTRAAAGVGTSQRGKVVVWDLD